MKIFKKTSPNLAGVLALSLCLFFFALEVRGGTVVEVFQFQYSNAADLEETARGLLSEEGSVSANASKNVLVVMDRPEIVERIRAILAQLDQRPGVIVVEVEFVETDESQYKGMDLQWRAGAGGWTVGTLPSGRGMESSLSGMASGSHSTKKQFLRLLENRPGRIFVGESVPLTEYFLHFGRRHGYIAENITFKEVGTSFSVTARRAGKGTIEITLDPEVSYYDRKKESFIVKKASTSVLVGDPGTVVLGGMEGGEDSFTANFLRGIAGSNSRSNFTMVLSVHSSN